MGIPNCDKLPYDAWENQAHYDYNFMWIQPILISSHAIHEKIKNIVTISIQSIVIYSQAIREEIYTMVISHVRHQKKLIMA